MRIISTCKMGPGTFEAKFIPLSKIDSVEKIYVLRDTAGPIIDKVHYIIIPSVVSKNKSLKFIVPFILAFYTIKYKCDLIIGYHIIPHAFYSRIASVISRTPYACAQTGLDIQKFSKKDNFGWLLKRVLSKALFINVPGNSSKDFWSDFGVSSDKIKTLHSTIDINRFHNMKLDKEYDFVILSRLSEEKRIEKLLGVFLELKNDNLDFKVAIVGDGPRKEFLETITKEYQLEDRVDFIGFVNNTEQWFNNARCFLLSSESEGFPTALMQAMSCGLIAVSTDVGNISDTIVNGVNGYIVEYGDWTQYKKILKEILENSDTSQLQINARESIVVNHSYESAIRKWSEVLNQYNLI